MYRFLLVFDCHRKLELVVADLKRAKQSCLDPGSSLSTNQLKPVFGAKWRESDQMVINRRIGSLAAFASKVEINAPYAAFEDSNPSREER